MSPRLRGWAIAGGLLAAALLAGAALGRIPGPSASPAGRTGPRRLVIGVRSDVTSLNIYTAASAFDQEIADLLYPKLAYEADDFQQGPPTFRPGLASSWEFSADGRRLTFHLDPRAVWSDGRPVTAADVLLSHRAASSPEVAWAGIDVKEFIEEVTAPDERTVVYRFARVYPYRLMDAVEGNILPAHVFGNVSLAEWPRRAFLEAPVAGGPFRLRRYERGALLELERNPAYLKAPLPWLDSVVFRVIPDEEALLNELLSGGIDLLENLHPRAAARVEASPRLRLLRVPDLSYTFICWNTARPLFANPLVRRALTLAIDREAIVEGLLPGVGRTAAGPVLSFLWARDPALRPLPFDPDAARRLFGEAGWRDRDGDGLLDHDGRVFRFELETNQGSGQRADAARMVAAQLRAVGVEAVPRVFESGTFIARHETHEFDAFLGSWLESTKVDLRSNFHTAAGDGGYNYGRYGSPELDRVIDRARAVRDPEASRLSWIEAQRIIAYEQPYTFLFERDRLHAAPRHLRLPPLGPRSLYARLEEWSGEDRP
ncbi:MAG: ABC transporter substrate-binding protein [Candidatus Polarisedimenticolia bacterium]